MIRVAIERGGPVEALHELGDVYRAYRKACERRGTLPTDFRPALSYRLRGIGLHVAGARAAAAYDVDAVVPLEISERVDFVSLPKLADALGWDAALIDAVASRLPNVSDDLTGRLVPLNRVQRAEESCARARAGGGFEPRRIYSSRVPAPVENLGTGDQEPAAGNTKIVPPRMATFRAQLSDGTWGRFTDVHGVLDDGRMYFSLSLACQVLGIDFQATFEALPEDLLIRANDCLMAYEAALPIPDADTFLSEFFRLAGLMPARFAA